MKSAVKFVALFFLVGFIFYEQFSSHELYPLNEMPNLSSILPRDAGIYFLGCRGGSKVGATTEYCVFSGSVNDYADLKGAIKDKLTTNSWRVGGGEARFGGRVKFAFCRGNELLIIGNSTLYDRDGREVIAYTLDSMNKCEILEK